MIGDGEWMREALARLVAIDSRSGREAEVQILVESLMRQAGADEVRRVPVDRELLASRYGFASTTDAEGMHALVGVWQGGRGDRRIVVNAHVDTVPPAEGWTTDPYEPSMRDGRMFGLGTADTKAALVGALAALARAREAGTLVGRVELHAVPDEEAGGGSGTMACIDRMLAGSETADLVIVGEPTSLGVAAAQVGSYAFRLSVRGIAAHANTKSQGLSAVEEAMDLCAALREWPERVSRPRTARLPDRAVNVGRFRGGVGATSVAAQAEAEVCVTYHPADAGLVRAEIDEIVRRRASVRDPRLVVELHELHDVHPFAAETLSGPAAALVALSPSGVPTGFPAGSDGRLFVEHLGVPAVIFGPGSLADAHRADESVPLHELSAHADILTRFLTD